MWNTSLREAGSGVLRWMIGAKRNGNRKPMLSSRHLMPSECGVMSTSTAPTFGAGDDRRLDRRPHGHAQVGVDLLVGRLAEPFLQQLR